MDKRQVPLVKQLGDFASGITDGLTISLAVASGLWFAAFEPVLIAAASLIVSCAVAVVMAAGCFFSRRNQLMESPEHALAEWNRTRKMMEKLGLSSEQLLNAENAWLKERSETIQADQPKVPFNRVVMIGFSFLAGGLVPALCFYLSGDSSDAWRISLVVSGLCFITFGYLRDKANGLNPWFGAARALLLGLVAVAVSIFLARLFV